ncbi:MAG: hypothetical protein WB785_12785 [Mycobacterium sp.]|uniref:hypothetical protein n=1 Tax=Mycobacterium sp. TaxID=1785 RepID=UPI003C5160E3
MAALIGVAGTALPPIASADTLPNGLTVSCSPDSDSHSTCIIGGCPRVNGDYVVDALHVMFDGADQNEYDFKCINGQTHRVGSEPGTGVMAFGVQACRKVTVGGDHCTPYSHYGYTPPAKAAPVPAPAPAPQQQGQPEAPAPAAVPAAVPAPPKDAIKVNENQAGQVSFDVNNTSSIDVQCNYNAKETRGLNVPATVSQSKAVAAGQSATFGPFANPVLATYAVTISCSGTFQGQPYAFNSFQTNVSG